MAVKIVHPELAGDPEFMIRFQHEAEAAVAVGGVYTAPVLGAGPTDSPPWLATAFVAGPSLADLVARTGPLPPAAVWRLAGGLVEALQAIHAQGLVHRDLKPGNILLAPDGPRVIDFGISRALQGAHVTATRMTMGTPAFMSPEQVEGGDVGPVSDIFSLGSVLAYAATGTAPFEGGQPFAIFYKVISGEPDLSGLPEGPYGPTGPGLRALVAACLTKDPARRPTLDQLISAIATASNAFPPVAPGSFWPAAVAALIESRISPTPGMGTPPPGMRTPPVMGTPPPGMRTPPGVPAGQPMTPVPTPVATPVPGPTQYTTPPARRPGGHWIVLTASGVAVAAAIGGILALALSHGGSSTSSGTTTPSASAASAAGGSSTGASPSASSSLIAVTVCTEPADGCTVAGASQYMEVKPAKITTSGDGSAYVDKINWSSWGGSRAAGSGTLELNNCNPNCAQGTFTGYPATVTLDGLKPYGTGLEAYSTIVVQSSYSGGDRTYTSGTVP
ncbi:MAG: putative molecular chaperone with protein kinase domain [Actinomycetia bacterium]|nr:putative molecular chaperone with protein kinase domain [Actinomycetes bacterium]